MIRWIFQYVTEKENPSFPYRSCTYDLPITSTHAPLPLSLQKNSWELGC